MDDLQALLDFNPPILEIDPNRTPAPSSPLTFYDMHIDSHLLLKRVVPMPSIPHSLSSAVDQKIHAMENSCVAFPPKNSEELWSLPDQEELDAGIKCAIRSRRGNDARELVWFYETSTSVFCRGLATILSIFPNVSSCWFSLLSWEGHLLPETIVQRYVTEFHALRLHEMCADKSKLPNCLGQDLKTQLQETYARYPELATWQILDLSVENEEVIRAMDKVACTPTFPFQTCLTTGHPSLPDIPIPPDALKTPWTIPPSLPLHTNANQDVDAPWRNTRARHRADANPTMTTGVTDVSIKVMPKRPSNPRKVTKSPVIVAQELLQHAWARCVSRDTTLVIFYCGNIERIGIRHRQSQTLYLSNIIDIHACKDPAYGKLHVGLYLAALEDALDRVKQHLSTEAEAQQDLPVAFPPGHGKRQSTEDHEYEGPRRKRVKTDLNLQREQDRILDHQNQSNVKGKRPGKGARRGKDNSKRKTKADHNKLSLEDEVACRKLALLYVRYDGFNSPSPGSFLRINPETHSRMRLYSNYPLNACISLVLTSRIGSGSTGTAHCATLEVRTNEDPPITREVVVKLSFNPEQHDRMRNEYRLYQHLAGTPGILHVFGLFEDIERGILALVMEHGGSSLWDRGQSDTVKASPSERKAFIAVLNEIHEAGVVHHDVRPPNLLVRKDGKVFIIDFDKAELNDDESEYASECCDLQALLDGNYFPN